ncbi:MAG: universal stress protein [Bacteroidia bacterium]|nr:universal stress protein [Bacteroidia bacterium]
MKKLLLLTDETEASQQAYAYSQALCASLRLLCEHHPLTPYTKDRDVAQLALQQEADLIVMGIPPVRGLAHPFTDLDRVRLLARAPRPMLLIPPSARFAALKHIVYATNFQEDDWRIPPTLEALARLSGARITCVHINPVGAHPRHPVMQEVFRSQLEPGNIFFYVIRHKDPLQGLQLFTDAYHPDMLAVMPARRSLAAWLLKPNLTRALARRTQIPLLSVQTTIS